MYNGAKIGASSVAKLLVLNRHRVLKEGPATCVWTFCQFKAQPFIRKLKLKAPRSSILSSILFKKTDSVTAPTRSPAQSPTTHTRAGHQQPKDALAHGDRRARPTYCPPIKDADSRLASSTETKLSPRLVLRREHEAMCATGNGGGGQRPEAIASGRSQM